jgi:tetratricopeptide (TPR) repeat protein
METTAAETETTALDFQAVAVWLLGFALVAYLGLSGGGYDPILRNQLGIAVWWGLLLGLAVGALPLGRLRYGSWVALGLLAAYVAWVALSLAWSDVPASTVDDLGRVVVYLGVFALALSIRGGDGARRMVGALGAAIVLVAAVALLSRLHPAWFPDAGETVAFLTGARARLAYPLGYWNGVASLTAIGLPLVLYLACCARHVAVRAPAAAALPAMALAIYFTFSRGGTLAALVAVALFLALAHDRLPKLATTLLAAAGAAILIAAAGQREALDAGFAGPLAREQGDELLALTLLVCAGVGLLQAAFASAERRVARPAWSRPSRRLSLALLVAAMAVAVAAGLAAGAAGKASDAWREFKQSDRVARDSSRLGSFSSNGRWPLWSSALEQNGTAPLRGEGSGSFEAWWARNGTRRGFVRDAHSLYMETLGELGIAGLALMVGFLGWVLAAGTRRWSLAAGVGRTQLAAALAGCAAFCLGAGFDWLWELAVIPIAFLLLASVLVGAGERRQRPLPLPARLAGVGFALAATIAIAIPLSAASSLERSRAEVRAGDLGAALSEAADARRVEPFAAAPRLQQALVSERLGDLAAAEAAARGAVRREPVLWGGWLVLSRIQAERGRARAALASYRRAKALNPGSPLFGG